MTTIAPPAPPNNYAAAIARALGGKPCHDPNAPCQPCVRYELQFLPALPSVVAAEHAGLLKEAGYAWAPSFDEAFTEMPREATLPVARLARTGYVYLYYADWQTWDVWQVMPNGLTRKLLHQVERTKYELHQSALAGAPPAKLCSQGAANVPAHLIGIYGARNATKVWIAFSPHLWTGATLQRYADNPEVDIDGAQGKPIKTKLRAVRGIEVNPKAIVAGQFPTRGALPLNEAALKSNVIEYCALPERAIAPAWPAFGFDKAFAFEASSRPLTKDRFGQAAAFAQRVRQLELTLSPSNHPKLYENKTLILMLPDAEGVNDAHNHLRIHTLAQRQLWLAGGPDAKGRNEDPDRPWKRQSLLHAGYIREWVKTKEKNTHQERLDHGLYRTNYVISAFEYQQIQAQERQTGKTVNPPGTTYEKLPGTPERYRVTFPKKSVDQGIEDLAVSTSKGRIERYNGHLDWEAIKTANQQWLAAEQEWVELLNRRDRDYVRWIRGSALQTALRYDFDDERALREAQRTPEQLKRDVLEMVARLEATARCFGGGACSDESLKLLIEMFRKDEKNKGHFIAQAMIGEFEALDKFIAAYRESPGVQADMYDAVTASKASWNEFKTVWEQVKERAAAASDTLTQVALQVTQRMKELALQPEMAQKRGLMIKLQEATQKQVVWARAAGFAEFVNEGTRQYMVGVRWSAGAFAEACAELNPPAVDARERSVTGKQARKARIDTRAELKPFLAKHASDAEATIMLVLDEKELKAIARARGEKMLDVVSPGLFGLQPGVVSVPESMAKRIVRDRMMVNAMNLKNASTVLNAGVFYLQAMAVAESWENIAKKGGLDQVDAVASLLGGISGLAGATSELAALLLTPPAANAAGAPLAAELASKVPAYLKWKFAAGLFMAAGSVFDSAVAFAKFYKFGRQGDSDASKTYAITSGLQLLGGISMGVGQYYAYRAAALNRLGAQGAVRLLASSFSPLQLSRCLTGIGLVLWLAGLGLSFYALYLEDDSNEIFLRRSFFGKGHPQLGKFTDLDHEVQSFGALALGTSAELEWHDHVMESDEFTARVKVFKPEPTSVVTAVLEGFDKINGRKVIEIFKGDMPLLKPERPAKPRDDGPDPDPRLMAPGEVYVTERRIRVPDDVEAIRLTYALYDNRAYAAYARARGELWIED